MSIEYRNNLKKRCRHFRYLFEMSEGARALSVLSVFLQSQCLAVELCSIFNTFENFPKQSPLANNLGGPSFIFMPISLGLEPLDILN